MVERDRITVKIDRMLLHSMQLSFCSMFNLKNKIKETHVLKLFEHKRR